LFFLVIISLLIFFSSVNKQSMQEANQAIKVTNSRHSILAEINFLVRKMHLIGIQALAYGTGTQTQIDITKQKVVDYDQINEKSNLLQQHQFEIGESIRTMNDNLGKDVTVKNINNYAQTNPGQIDVIQSGYESTLFQYTAETFQVNNATMTDIQQSYLATSLNDTTRNIMKAFSGIFYNGLRDLRSAALQISQDVYDIYTAEIRRSFLLYTILLSCIGIGLVIVGTALLVPTVFKVMRTTRLVITLFGMIEDEDILALTTRCEKFTEEYLKEGEKKKEGEEEAEKQPPAQEKDVPVKDNASAKPEGSVNNGGGLVPRKENEEEPFDIKTEKLPTLTQGQQLAIKAEANKKGIKTNGAEKKPSETDQKKNLLNNGEPQEDEKSAPKPTWVKMDEKPTKEEIAKEKDQKQKKGKAKKAQSEKKYRENE
jgi:hypothetical protein